MDRDVIHFDAPLGQEFFNISVRKPVSEIPADSQHDHFGREPVSDERRAIHWRRLIPEITHFNTLARH
jgi:hypothetical protein